MYRGKHVAKHAPARGVRRGKNQKKRRLLPLVCVAVGLLSCALLLGAGALLQGTLGRYAAEKEYEENQVLGGAFYFTVDLLGDTDTDGTLTKTIDLYGGSAQTVRFNVQNYYDSKRATTAKTTYTVAKTGDDAELYREGTAVTSGTDSGELAGGQCRSCSYELRIPAYKADKTVTVTVSSTSPYTKTMTLNFVLHAQPVDVTWRVEDSAGSVYATLVVMSHVPLTAGQLQVDWSALNPGDTYAFQVDTTSPYVLNGDLLLTANDPGSGHLNSLVSTRSLRPRESISVYFFKADMDANYATVTDQAAVKSGDVYTITLQDLG